MAGTLAGDVDAEPSPDGELAAVVAEDRDRLLRMAFLLCGSRSRAEDAVSSAVERVLPRLRARSVDAPRAYVRTAVVNEVPFARRREAADDRRLERHERATPTAVPRVDGATCAAWRPPAHRLVDRRLRGRLRPGGPRTICYGATAEYPATDAYGNGGAFFSGGDGTHGVESTSELRQTVPLPYSEIDSGNLNAEWGGTFGGYLDQTDEALAVCEFLNANGTVLKTDSAGPVPPQSYPGRNGETKLVEVGRGDRVPAGTRSVRITLRFTKEAGGVANDGYADNIWFFFRA